MVVLDLGGHPVDGVLTERVGGVQMASLVGGNIVEADVDGVVLRVLVVRGILGVDGDRRREAWVDDGRYDIVNHRRVVPAVTHETIGRV